MIKLVWLLCSCSTQIMHRGKAYVCNCIMAAWRCWRCTCVITDCTGIQLTHTLCSMTWNTLARAQGRLHRCSAQHSTYSHSITHHCNSTAQVQSTSKPVRRNTTAHSSYTHGSTTHTAARSRAECTGAQVCICCITHHADGQGTMQMCITAGLHCNHAKNIAPQDLLQ